MVPGLIEDLQGGIAVADVGCGAGHAINLMARTFPHSRFTGYDMSEEGIRMAREEAQRWGLTNASFEVRDAARIDAADTYDLITTFDAIHDQAHPDRVLRGIYEALKPQGVYLCVDIAASSNLQENLSHPIGPALYMFSVMHCMTVSLAYGGMGLGTVWGRQKAIEMIEEAGFKNIEVKQVEGDFFNNYYVATK
jgi:ubiquinone/menaquinone biosynthesis C-methylase UbiE